MKYIISSGELQKALETISSVISSKKNELYEIEKSYESNDYDSFLSGFLVENNFYHNDDDFYDDWKKISVRRSESQFVQRQISLNFREEIKRLEAEIRKLSRIFRFLRTSILFIIIRDVRSYIKIMKSNINYRTEEDNVALIKLNFKFLLIPTYRSNEQNRIKK